MKKELEILVNWIYKEWCKTSDPYDEDFESELAPKLPHLKFGFNPKTNKWVLITDIHCEQREVVLNTND